MTHDLSPLRQELSAAIAAAPDLSALEELRVTVLGKKGRVTELMKTLGTLSPEDRKTRGAALNVLKDELTQALSARHELLAAVALQTRLERERIDVTLSPRPQPEGRIHPISQTMDEIITAFAAMGFSVARGPDIETDAMNFTMLNLPPNHPARDMQSTFFLPDSGADKIVLRTQTSSV